MIKEQEENNVDQVKLKIFRTRKGMGIGAANDVAKKIKELIAEQDNVNIIFAAAPSQNEFLDALSKAEGIDWTRVNAFHMDEYIGLSPLAPQRFGQFLKTRLFDKIPLKKVYYMNGYKKDEANEMCDHYADLLVKHPADIVCMGIGENAHIAFNDPHVADFNDQKLVKLVELEEVSRMQQVHDDCFDRIEDVPKKAVTLTVPALLQARYIFCIVPGINKAEAVYHTLYDGVSEKYPSSILRQHPNAILYLDESSAAKIKVDHTVINS